MIPRFLLSLVACSVLLLGLGAPGLLAQEATPAFDPADFSPVVTNPLFPLAAIRQEVFEGEEQDPGNDEPVVIRVEMTVLPETKTIAGIEATVVEVMEYADGELTERTLDYYAQHRDGTVYYLGEDVDVYDDGEIVGHEGAWLAGESKNQPGVYMPANLEVGQVFEQERAPGVAEDQSTVTAVGESLETRAGTYEDCIVAEDLDPLSGEEGQKIYCPGVGIAREESPGYAIALVSVEPSTEATPSGG
jgi:hypothetical protein